jgi:hypothetical protein
MPQPKSTLHVLHDLRAPARRATERVYAGHVVPGQCGSCILIFPTAALSEAPSINVKNGDLK